MQKIILLLLPLLFIFGCKPSLVKQSFSSADSLVIHFKNEQQGVVTKTVQTTDTKAISRVIEFIDGKTTDQLQCNYDGKMFFFSEGKQIQEVDFNMTEKACTQFSLLINGKLISTKMNPQAIDFFNAQQKGLLFY